MMERLKELHGLREDVINTMSGLNDERRAYEQEIAEISCPFYVGELVVNEKGVRATIASIKFSSWSEGYEFSTRKIKANGDPYLVENRAWGHEGWKKVEDK